MRHSDGGCLPHSQDDGTLLAYISEAARIDLATHVKLNDTVFQPLGKDQYSLTLKPLEDNAFDAEEATLTQTATQMAPTAIFEELNRV